MADTVTRTAGDESAQAGGTPSRVERPAGPAPRPAARSLRRLLRHEAAAASVAGLFLAVAMIWLVPPFAVWIMSAGATPPVIADPVHTITGDTGDPSAQSWLLAWDGHALLHDIGHLWSTNAFYPEPYPLALNDSLLGYAPFALVGSGVAAAVLRYNVVLVLAFALASVGAYALARQLGANRVGAAVAGAAFAYAPWRYAHDGHLNVLSTGGIVLALAMLARGHGWSLTAGYRPERVRAGWAVAGWLAAAWQVSLGFAVGLPFVYVLLLACVVGSAGWLLRGRPRVPRRLLLADLGGGLAFSAVSLYFAYFYLRVRDLYPESVRPWDYVAWFSPTWRSLLTAPDSSLPWGRLHEDARTALGVVPAEKVLLCGYVLYGLAALGLAVSVWTARQRAWLAGGAAVTVLLALGANGPLYRFWYSAPGFDGSRTPGRLIVWPTLLLGLLAAGAVTELAGRLRRAALPAQARTVVLGVTLPLLALVLFEGLPRIDHPAVPVGPSAAMAAAPGPMIVLPSDEGIDLNVLLWSTAGFPTMVNGTASINPARHQAIRDLLQRFPGPDCLAELRALGIRGVVVDRSRVVGTPYQALVDVSTAGTGVDRRDVGGAVVYSLG
jgi:hypothetical protein